MWRTLLLLLLTVGCTASPKHTVSTRPGSGFSLSTPLAVQTHPRDNLEIKEKIERILAAKGFVIVSESQAKKGAAVYLFAFDFEADLTGGFDPQFTFESFVFWVSRPGSQEIVASGNFRQNATALGWKNLDEVLAEILGALATSLETPGGSPPKR